MTIEVPPSVSARESGTAGVKVRRPIGMLRAGEVAIADWRMQLPADFNGQLESAVRIVGEASGCTPTSMDVAEDSAVSFGETHELSGGEHWIEATYRATGQPSISLEPISDDVVQPRIGHEEATLGYRDTLHRGERLVFDAEGGARLFATALLDDDGSARIDQNAATGFRAFVQGYVVQDLPVAREIMADEPLEIRITGQVSGGAESQVVLRYRLADGQTHDQTVLVNQFTEAWREVSQSVNAPQGAMTLERVFLYRRGETGKVWYGPMRVARADMPREGRDVSDQIVGRFPRTSQGRVHIFRYTDGDVPLSAPRTRVQLLWTKQ